MCPAVVPCPEKTAGAIRVGRLLEEARQEHAAHHLAAAARGYGQVLECDARNPVALLGLSLAARQSGQKEEALRMAVAALDAATEPVGAALALAHVGHCLAGLGRWDDARHAFRRVLAWCPDKATPFFTLGGYGRFLEQARLQAHIGLGEMLVSLGDLGEASLEFKAALQIDPGLAAVHFGLGNALAMLEDWVEALRCFERVVYHLPTSPEAHFGVAFCLVKLGDLEGAIERYRQSIELRPSFAGAWLNLGVALVADGRDGLGACCYREVLGMTREADALVQNAWHTRASALLNLGHLERGRRRFAAALPHYLEALNLVECCESGAGERQAEVHVALCSWHLEQGQIPQAWQALRRAEALNGNEAEVNNVRGILLLAEDSRGAGRQQDVGAAGSSLIAEAMAAFSRAETLGHRTAASNRGNALLRLGRCEEALAAHMSAVSRNPLHPGARYNLALTQLRLGDFRWGWVNYEARWAFRDVHARPRRFQQPRWQGEPGGTVFVYAEQGLGDTVQFARFLCTVAARLVEGGAVAELIVEIPPPLVRLLSPLVEALQADYPGLRAAVLPPGEAVPSFSAHCPLMSLPAVFAADTEQYLSAGVPYLRYPSSERGTENGQLSIGIAWKGNPQYKADAERSTTLKRLMPLFEEEAIRWVSLQKDASQEIGATRSLCPPDCELEDACSQDRDLADTAAVIARLDLVITTDTVIAHLAGAMGKPVWILLCWQADWRWMQLCDTTPWYATARLFRQKCRSGWTGLVDEVAFELKRLSSGGRIEAI